MLDYLSCSRNRRTPNMDYKIFLLIFCCCCCCVRIHYTHGEPSLYCLIGRTSYTEFDIREISGRLSVQAATIMHAPEISFSLSLESERSAAAQRCRLFLSPNRWLGWLVDPGTDRWWLHAGEIHRPPALTSHREWGGGGDYGPCGLLQGRIKGSRPCPVG